MTLQKRRQRQGILFFTPAVLALTVIHVFPTLATIYLSFTNSKLGQVSAPVGPDNYRSVLSSASFWNSVWVTVRFSAISVALLFTLSLLAAMLILYIPKLRRLIKGILFLPVILSESVTALVWAIMLSPTGVINSTLLQLGVIQTAIPWLTTPGYALASMILFMVWKELGYFLMIFLVGLEGIPREYYDAARLDGAGSWSLFRYVVLPLLRPTVYLALVVLLTKCFNVFAPFYVITGGGPYQSTESLSMLIYDTGFKFIKMGKASAMTVVVVAALAGMSLLLNRFLKQREKRGWG